VTRNRKEAVTAVYTKCFPAPGSSSPRRPQGQDTLPDRRALAVPRQARRAVVPGQSRLPGGLERDLRRGTARLGPGAPVRSRSRRLGRHGDDERHLPRLRAGVHRSRPVRPDEGRPGDAGAPSRRGRRRRHEPWHGLVWSGFEVISVAGVSTASYALQPWALAIAAVGAVFPLVASVLLFDTVVSYGPLYRRGGGRRRLSTLPPTAALYAWLFGLGSAPTVNFATVLFLPHVLFDAYAFVGSDMFEFHPATRRTGERAALDDLGNPSSSSTSGAASSRSTPRRRRCST